MPGSKTFFIVPPHRRALAFALEKSDAGYERPLIVRLNLYSPGETNPDSAQEV
jgi:hypothetical protein